MKTMVSVTEAQDIVLSHAVPSAVQVLPLQYILGAVLAAPVRAQVDVPAFDNSAMDGFALDHHVTEVASPDNPVRLPIVGFQAAGLIHFGSLKPGNALRIATGAYVPMDATAVVPLEEVQEEGETVVITAPIKMGAHVRRCAEETRRGDLILEAGTPITASVLGYLASIGVAEVAVHSRPRVGIITTGTELVPLGGTPGPGQIFDSNSIALAAAMQVDGIGARVYPSVDDDAAVLRQALEKVMAENEVVVVTGGVSVGERDHVRAVMEQLEITPLFWKVRQKPGKPVIFGARDSCLFFGLPGNPASSLVAYYQYVRPALRKIMGHIHCVLPEMMATSEAELAKDADKTYFLRARLELSEGEWQATPCEDQGSNRMRSFAMANAIVVLPEGVAGVAKGGPVCVQLLPQAW